MHHIETRSHQKLTAASLGTYFNWWDTVAVPREANQSVKQEECKYAEVRTSPQRQSFWHRWVQVPWLPSPSFLFSSPFCSFLFSHPSEFRKHDLGGKLLLCLLLSRSSLCFTFALPFLLLENYHQVLIVTMIFGQKRGTEKELCSWFSGTYYHFTWLCLPPNNYWVAVSITSITAAHYTPSSLLCPSHEFIHLILTEVL